MKNIKLVATAVFLLLTCLSTAQNPDITPSIVQSTRDATVIVQVREKDETTFSSNGTGWFYESKNTIITAKHVIDTAIECKVVCSNGETLDVLTVKASPDSDIAMLVLKTPIKLKIKPIQLAKKQVVFGEVIYTVGHPFMEFKFHLSTGHVTNETYEKDYFLTSTPLLPGNSGGVFCNAKGEAVGIAIAKFVDTETINVVMKFSVLKKNIENFKNVK